jgi:hypothetical protein
MEPKINHLFRTPINNCTPFSLFLFPTNLIFGPFTLKHEKKNMKNLFIFQPMNWEWADENGKRR